MDPRDDDLWRQTLETQRAFDVVLVNGERWSCQLIRWGRDALLLSTPVGKYLLPRRSVLYVVLEEADDAFMHEETAAMMATNSEAVATMITGSDEEVGPPVP